MARFQLDDDLVKFLTEANAVVVATRDSTLAPFASRAAGLRVELPDRLTVMLPAATSTQSMTNLRANGDIAVCVSSPLTYRTMQLKGRFVRARECTDEDVALCQAQMQKFADACAVHGMGRDKIRNLFLFEGWCVDAVVTSAFVQTPGIGAGAPHVART